jgi:hypothetical protein
MFGMKTKEQGEATKIEKLPGPKNVPGLVEKYLTAEYKIEPALVQVLSIIMRKSPRSERAFDCRVFDPSEPEAMGVNIKDYNSLDEHPALILYEGWFDDGSKQVELVEKRKFTYDVPLFTEEQILQKIEALSEPGSTVFYYQARGPAAGGPLGRGAAVIELNPNYPQKRERKYNIYTASVVGTEPVANKQKLFNSDKPKEIAKWVKESHHKRMY